MKPKQFYFMMISLLGIVLLGLGAGYYFGSIKISGDTDALKQQLTDVQVAESTIDQLTTLKRQYQKIQPTLVNLDTALPPAKKQSEIIVQLQQIAASSGMTIPAASFTTTAGAPTAISQTTKEGDALVMPMLFQMTGSYEQLQSFLVGVEKLNRYTSISNLAITKSDKPKSLNFSISLNVYLKP